MEMPVDDSDESDKRNDFAPFLFGNIDKDGELDIDFLDEQSKKSLSSLGKLGLDSVISEIVDEEDVKDVSSCDLQTDITKSPSAVDYSDINELADEEEEEDEVDSVIVAATSGEEENQTTIQQRKLDTPLAGILPKKYANVDVRELFPDFSPNSVLRFSRLFNSTGKSYSSSRWKALKKRIKRRRQQEQSDLSTGGLSIYKPGWVFNLGTPPSSLSDDDEELFLKPSEEKQTETSNENVETVEDDIKPADWRYGSARFWYDMYNIPANGEGYTDGFKSVAADKPSETPDLDKEYPREVFHMVAQVTWEEEIIWHGEDVKQKVLQKLNSKPSLAGWIPTSSNRVAQQTSFSAAPKPGTSSSSSMLSGASSSVNKFPNNPGGSNSALSAFCSSNNKSSAAKQSTSLLPISSSSLPSTGGGGGKQMDENGEEVFYSIFPIENDELIYGDWEDEIIWDHEAVSKIPKPKIVTFDMNDENLLLEMPEDIDPTKQKQDSITPVKVKIPQPHVKKSKMLLGKAGVINMLEEDAPLSPNAKSSDFDPFNISNDKYYMSRISETSLKVGIGSLIQHSTPVIELRAPFVQTHMGPMRLRSFHRPPIKRFSRGALASTDRHFVTPLTKYIKKKSKQREQERQASGGGDVFFMRTPEDLTGRDGDIVLVEFSEEHPPLMNLVGMCSKMKNYYKRKTGKDQGPPTYRYGETAYAYTSPFLGSLPPGKSLQTMENNMYRAPIFEHDVPGTDFLVIRTRSQYFIREANGLYVAGQMCPLYEVPSPNSKRANNFVRDFLQVFIYRLFWKSKGVPKRICMDDVRKAFPSHSESSIRKRLKLCADFKRTGNDSNLWVIKKDFRLPPEEEIREMVSPEQSCAYFSMIAAEQRLKDAGYGEKFMFANAQDDDEDDVQLKIDDEIKVAPWNTTRAYIQAMKGKCLLQLTGPADPTGCGEGFSYIRVPNKPVVNRQNKDEQKSQPKRIVTGTDADLRRLSLNNAKALLRKFGVPEEEIKKLSRWEVIDVVRTLSTEKAKAGEESMTKFSRGNRFSIAEHQERYKEECQRIFDLQNKMLASNEYLSTSEDDSTDEENAGSDIEEMGKNIESMLANNTTSMQLSLEREEQERQELRKFIMDTKKHDKKKYNDDDGRSSSAATTTVHDVAPMERILKIYRTFRDPDGKSYTRLEVVRNSSVIDAYAKIRNSKDDEFIKQFAVLDDAQKEEMKREKRRIQEQLRRIKRNQEKERITAEMRSRFAHHGLSGGKSSLQSSSGGSASGKMFNKFDKHKLHHHSTKDSYSASMSAQQLSSRRRPKIKPDLKVRCGACGATGHMRTNKACPQYQQNAPPPPVVVALTQEEEREIDRKLDDEDDLVNVDGTKLKLSCKLIKHAEDVKRRSLLLKVPKDALIRKRKPTTTEDSHCDYLKKHKATNRRCIDPVVALSTILESILNEMRSQSEVQPFLFPVNSKNVPDYYKIVSRPMDLQTMRENLREKKYQTREEFLADVNQIVENSTLYNGAKSCLTLAAKQMLQLCVQRLAEKEDRLMRLEKAINPLLDDNDQVGLSYILGNILNKVKSMSESWPFSKPVNKRTVKDYYEIVKRPMDLETITNNIQGHKYHSRYEFLSDLELILSNCIAYNGPDSAYSQKAETILKAAQSSLEEFDEHLSVLEQKLKVLQDQLEQQTDIDSSLSDDQHPDDNEPFIGASTSTVSSAAAVAATLAGEEYEDEELEYEFKRENKTADAQNLLEDDLHCSSEDEDIDMMEEVRGIEAQEVANASSAVHDYESQQVAEAMMQLGNFDYRASTSSSSAGGGGNNNNNNNTGGDVWEEDDEPPANFDEREVENDEIAQHLDVKAFPTSFVYGDDYDRNNGGGADGIVETERQSPPLTTSRSNDADMQIMQEDLDISDSDEDAFDEFGAKLKREKLPSPNNNPPYDDNPDDNDGLWF